MMHFVKEELSALGQFLKSYSGEIIVVVFGTLFIALDKYQQIGSEWVSTFLYYGLFPLLVIMIILRKSPLNFGLRWGNVKIWGFYTILICLIAAAILYLSSFNPSLQKYYQNKEFSFITYSLTSSVSLWASEFIYRGFLLFGLKEKFKEGSILLQMVPFALLHLGKPELETLSTIITGLLFGYVAYRGKSFWPAFIIHLFINIFFVALVNFKYPAQ